MIQSKPIFNKRLYKAQAGITLSKQAKDILLRNATETRSESDLHTIRSVVSGLKEVHKNFEFAKAALGCAITYEKRESERKIEKTEEESALSCYYILSGSVEAFYQVKNGVTRSQEDDCTISYTHVAGDYIGLVSADGPRFDLPPPVYMTTIEHSEFIRIDRQVFHIKTQEAQKKFRNEITRFLDTHQIFGKLTEKDRNKLISRMVKQDFPAGKQILSQGKKQEHAFFIAEGRCRYYRRIFLPKQRRSELFNMGYVEKGSYFDASCILDDQDSRFSVITVGPVTCYLLNKWTVKNSESLLKALSVNRPHFDSDKSIECFMKESDEWQSYKRDMVCNTLVLKGKSPRLVPRDRVPRALNRAIRSGSTSRRQRRLELSTYPTDVQSSSCCKLRGHLSTQEETGSGNTKSVLKAVMLLKRSRGSIQKDVEDKTEVMETPTVNPKGYKNDTDVSLKSREKHPIPILRNQKFEIKQRARVETNEKRIPSETKQIKPNKTNSFTNRKRDVSEVPHSSKPHVQERWVTNERKFMVKEVVNTRIPGKSYSPTPTYRRFERSMFESFDKINSFHNKKLQDSSGTKITNVTLLKKVKESLTAGQNDYNPWPSPVIVIQEYCEEDDVGDVDESDKETGDKSTVNNKSNSESEVRPGRMETLIEDIDKENMAENTDKNEWKTAVHEARYESERCLEKTKQEIAKLEQQLVKLGWSRDEMMAREEKKMEGMKDYKNGDTKTEKVLQREVKKEKENWIKNERKRRTLKRQDSIQKILEDLSSVPHLRRKRSNTEKNENARPPSTTKRHSTNSLQSTKAYRERESLLIRTSSIS